jgi:hypothetical protein
MSATKLAEAIRSKQASSREVAEAHLERIEAVPEELKTGRRRRRLWPECFAGSRKPKVGFECLSPY